MHSFQNLLVAMFGSSVFFSEYAPLPYVCARGRCCRNYKLIMAFRNNCPENNVCHGPVTRATAIMEPEVEHLNDMLNKVSQVAG